MSAADRWKETEVGTVLAFWEKARLVFNAFLVAWTAFLLWQRFEPPPALTEYLVFIGQLFILANLAFCAAYPLDLWLGPKISQESRALARRGGWFIGTVLSGWFFMALISSA
jgi:hypothetical protein